MGIVKYIGSQFRKPTGFGGKLSTFVMNRINGKQYRATEEALSLDNAGKVLDIGFGNGFLLHCLAKSYDDEFYGIEISDDMLKAAAKRNRTAAVSGKMILALGNAEHLKFPDEFFDKIYTVNTIYFWDNLSAGLSEIHRVLKPGGAFVNTVYSQEFLNSLRYTRYGFAKYSIEKLVTTSTETGFAVEVKVIVPDKSYCLICRKNTD
jgi:ubiquinone/menaquinone biosynthesis C-methylase UbiE